LGAYRRFLTLGSGVRPIIRVRFGSLVWCLEADSCLGDEPTEGYPQRMSWSLVAEIDRIKTDVGRSRGFSASQDNVTSCRVELRTLSPVLRYREAILIQRSLVVCILCSVFCEMEVSFEYSGISQLVASLLTRGSPPILAWREGKSRGKKRKWRARESVNMYRPGRAHLVFKMTERNQMGVRLT
jgi:hypothetical protein